MGFGNLIWNRKNIIFCLCFSARRLAHFCLALIISLWEYFLRAHPVCGWKVHKRPLSFLKQLQNYTNHLGRVHIVVHFSTGKLFLVLPWPQVVYFLMILAVKNIIFYSNLFLLYRSLWLIKQHSIPLD
jgi:hypothetical protein